jgi:2-iminobutanoate/2-iminopropanoate deaminase
MRVLWSGLLLFVTLAAQAQVRAVVPNQAPAQVKRFSSPAVDAGDYVYISGQGPRRPDGSLPASFPEQCRQALEDVRSLLEAAGLKLENVVYTQVYLEDINHYEEVNRVFAGYFGKTPPARAVLGVARVPDSPIQINAIAVRSLADKRAVYPPNFKSDDSAAPGILTHDRLFVSAMSGSGWPGIQPHGFRQPLPDGGNPDTGDE